MRHSAWKADALPTELHPRGSIVALRCGDAPLALELALGLGRDRDRRRARRRVRRGAARATPSRAPGCGRDRGPRPRRRRAPQPALDDLAPLPALRAPAPERVLAEWAPALSSAGSPPRSPRGSGRSRRGPRAHAPVRRAAALGGDLRGLAHPGRVRRGAAQPRRCSRWSTCTSRRVRSCGGRSCRTRRTRLHWGQRATYLFGAFLLASPISLLLTLLPDPIYAFYEEAPRLWGVSALTDQQIAGVIMSGSEAVVFFAASPSACSVSLKTRPDEAVRAGARSGYKGTGDLVRNRLHRPQKVAIRGLHLLVLSAFAVAQPLFDLLGDTPEFFVVRGSTAWDIVVFGARPPPRSRRRSCSRSRCSPALVSRPRRRRCSTSSSSAALAGSSRSRR